MEQQDFKIISIGRLNGIAESTCFVAELVTFKTNGNSRVQCFQLQQLI